MPVVETTLGPIEYADTGGTGPVLLLCGGLAISGSLWNNVVRDLRDSFRCVVPTLPVGGHRLPMRVDAILSPQTVASLLGELMTRLDLEQVTLVENDSGHSQIFAGTHPPRLARLVLVSCEAFDNYPPGLPGKMVTQAARISGGLNALVQPLRFRPLRSAPLTYGLMAKYPISASLSDDWLQPLLTQRAIRHDLERYLRATDPQEMLAAATSLPSFNRPALVVWATEDPLMPLEHGRRLATLLPQGRLVEIADSYTLIPHDQPHALATALRQFMQQAA